MLNLFRTYPLAAIPLLSSVFFVGCNNNEQNETMKDPKGYQNIVVDSCEYLQYDAELLCGHQYTHHTYNARLITHKGNCTFCHKRAESK